MRQNSQDSNPKVYHRRGKLVWLQIAALPIALFVAHTAFADDSGYPWREVGYLPVASGTADATNLMYQVMFPDPNVWGPGPYPTVLDYSGYEPATTIFDGLDDRFL